MEGVKIEKSSMVHDDMENYIIKTNFNNVNFRYFDEI